MAVAKILMTFVLAALTKHICQLCLTPVFGSIPSMHSDNVHVICATWLVLAMSVAFQHTQITLNLNLMLTILIPASQMLLTRYSANIGPRWGPWLSLCVTSLPAIMQAVVRWVGFLETYIFPMLQNTKTRQVYLDLAGQLARSGLLTRNDAQMGIDALIGTMYTLLTTIIILQTWGIFQGWSASLITFLTSGSGVWSSRYGLQAFIVLLWSILSRSRLGLGAGVVSSLYMLSTSPHLPLPHNTVLLNNSLHAAGYSLAARQESVTGYISVLDNLKDGFRVMRCDHSLLGGEWTNKPEGHPAVFNEPIYSIFVMLEAVRLVESESSEIAVVPSDGLKEALVM